MVELWCHLISSYRASFISALLVRNVWEPGSEGGLHGELLRPRDPAGHHLPHQAQLVVRPGGKLCTTAEGPQEEPTDRPTLLNIAVQPNLPTVLAYSDSISPLDSALNHYYSRH